MTKRKLKKSSNTKKNRVMQKEGTEDEEESSQKNCAAAVAPVQGDDAVDFPKHSEPWTSRNEEHPQIAGTGQPTRAPTKRMEDQRNAKCHRIWTSPPLRKRVRETARGGGVDALGSAHEHYKPMLADHVAMESLERFANLIATARISERLKEAMACTVSARSGT